MPLALAAAALVRRIAPGRNVRFVRWGFSHVLFALLLGLLLLGTSVVLLPPSEAGLEPWIELTRTCAVQGAVALYLAWVARRVDPAGLRALGFPAGSGARVLAAGLVAWVLCLPSLLALSQAWPALRELLGEEPSEQALLVALRALPPAELLGVALLVVLVVPFLEELLFRAFLQPLLVQNLNEPVGIVVTSLCFAMLHGGEAFLPIFALSLLLGALMLRTQRLSTVWLVHALNNALVLCTIHA